MTDLLNCPNFNEEFKTHTDARNFQLGAVISNKEKPIGLYSRNITGAHKRYTVTKKEMLSIVKNLK